MSPRQQELMVVGGLVLGVVVLGYLQLGPKSAHKAADDAVKRGAMQEAAQSARECESADGGLLQTDARLSCIARLAELEYGVGKVTEARTRLDLALAEAANEGARVSGNTRSELLATSSLVGFTNTEREVADARAALSFATDLRHRATANSRLGAALRPAASAEGPLRTARAQYLELEGPDSMNFATVGIELGGLLRKRDANEAISVLEASAATYARVLDGGHPFGGVALAALSRVRLQQHDSEGAEADLKKAIIITRAGFGATSPYLQTQLCEMGELLFELGRDTEAVVALEEGVSIAQRMNHPDVDCRRDYAGVLNRLGKQAESHGLLVVLLAELEATPATERREKDLASVRRMLTWVDTDGGL
jgi:tetratricopeptide (TPR) repeat protein